MSMLRSSSTPYAGRRPLRAALALLTAMAALGLTAMPAQASSVTAVTVTGTTGTVATGSGLYAKQGATVTLNVTTSADTKCVEVAGAFTARQTSATAKTSWTVTTTAGAGNGAQSVTVAASPNFNANNCTGQTSSTQSSYTLDNTAPVVSGSLTPAANAAGWNNANTTLTWSATDAGSGVESGPTPASSSESANGPFTRTSTATDRLGNTGTGSVTVRVDKAAPTVTGTQTQNADGTTTVTFTCTDSPANEASGVASCLAGGSTTSSRTVTGPTTVTGTATDKAGNTASTTVTVAASDKTAPTITHAVTPTPNAAGWNKADATVTFTCSDNVAVASCVADGTTSTSRVVGAETPGTLVGGTAIDTAGNTAKDAVTVKLDKTTPTASVARDRAPNAAGWYNADVTVSFTCADPGTVASGVATCPPTKTVAEGADQSASGSATDNAGNSSALAGVTGVNVDKTAPTLSGSFSPGWHTGDVTVAWTCTDGLSGVASTPSPSTVAGEGDNLGATAACTDKAGNTTTKTVTGIRIDRTAPVTTITGVSNTWTNGEVVLTLSATDNLSGVAATRYTVDGGAATTGTSLTLQSEGDHTVSFWSVDTAGNTETTRTLHVTIDRTAPTIGHSFPAPAGHSDSAWTNQDVQVSFTCADQGGSDVASCLGATTVTTEGTGQPVVGTATDGAGNSATDTALVSIDKTAPTVAATKDREPNAAGWYNADVTVSFACGDALSGVATCPAAAILGEGAGQSAGGTAIDTAGNSSAAAGVTGVNVDTTAPVLTGAFSAGWHTGDVTVSWTCTDALSGPAAQPAGSVVTGEGSNLTATSTCSDKAGNATTTTVSGIMIDRTAPTTGVEVSGPTDSGWYRAGVDVTLTGADNLSGVASTYYSVDGGSAQKYSETVPVIIDGTHTIRYWSVDVAGNTEGKHELTLKIDQTPPTLSGQPTSAPNGDGWYAGDVTVAWTCSDATSGIDGTCPPASTVTGEGAALTASASVSDVAGNATNTTVGGMMIDRTAPTTVGAIPTVPTAGWFTGGVKVTLNGSDNLSGVKSTVYSLDGGDPQAYGDAFTVTGDGQHSVTFHSTDTAGNVETAPTALTFQIDTTAPTTTVTSPMVPDSGWFVTSGIPFAFAATDATSGVAATYYQIDGGAPNTYGDPFTADLSDGTHAVTYWSVDVAGNAEGQRTFDLSLDTVAPSITGAQSPAKNAFGWNNTDVAVTFTCSDGTSGIRTGVAGCAGDTTLSNQGAGQTVKGDAVDVAGNTSSTSYGPVNIDKTAPTLTGVPADANGAGWYQGDVAVTWVGDDGLSGLDPATQPAASLVTGEGRALGASATISDKAGNVGAGSVTGLRIDRSAPTLTGKATTLPNAAGWYSGDVVVDWTCADAKLADGTDGSGVALCPTSSLLKGDGAGQSTTSGVPTDLAGNTGAVATVSKINIDGTPPVTTANNQCTATNGWCTGTTADIVLTAADQAGLSGVKEIRYKVDGGAEQVAAGPATTVQVPLNGSGAGTVEYWAVDVAGNAETSNKVALKWDNIAPAVAHTLNPAPNADEWNNADVTVTFTAKDDDKGSGVASVSAPVKVTTETAGQVVTGTAKDTAGNVGTDTVTVKLDKTAPSITGAITAGSKGDNGWYTGPVTVTFTCVDTLSGVATCPDPVTLTANGENKTASGTATDKAGNTASATVSGIKIDTEKPTLTTAGVNVAGSSYPLGTAPKATCTAKDDFSLVASCTVTVTGGTATGVGTFAWSATARDNAGNTTTITGTYQVTYRWDGFLQPINDTAHQVGVSTSMFKAGSTVPVKLQLKNAAGQVVQPVSAPVWLTPVKGSATSAPVNETSYSDSSDSGSAYRYDTAAQQWIYTWKTGTTGGSYWRIGVKLDDGQTYYVNIGLR